MPTVTMERLDEIATAWRRGLDADELANPAGPLFASDAYTEYEITATGGGGTWETWLKATHFTTWASAQPCEIGDCLCCMI